MYKLIENLTTVNDVKKILKANDIRGTVADSLMEKWQANREGIVVTTKEAVVDSDVEKTEDIFVAPEEVFAEPEASEDAVEEEEESEAVGFFKN